MSERTATEVEDRTEKDIKREKNGETPERDRRVVGSGGRKDKGIRKRKVAREKNT